MALRTPTDVHGVRTAAEYRQAQRDYVRRLKTARPGLGVEDPRVLDTNPPVRVVHGKWVVICTNERGGSVCNDPVSVHPDWQLACCFRCGAIYENVEMPENAAAIEAALDGQPRHVQNWAPGDEL